MAANSLWAKGAHAELRREGCVIVEKYLHALRPRASPLRFARSARRSSPPSA
jgi:hypothetical protein